MEKRRIGMLDGLFQGPGRRNNLYLHGPVVDRPGRAPGGCFGLDFHGMSESHKFTAEKFATKCRWHGAKNLSHYLGNRGLLRLFQIGDGSFAIALPMQRQGDDHWVLFWRQACLSLPSPPRGRHLLLQLAPARFPGRGYHHYETLDPANVGARPLLTGCRPNAS